jgi:hypothetical protein
MFSPCSALRQVGRAFYYSVYHRFFFFWIFKLKERIYIYMFGFYPHVRTFFLLVDQTENKPNCFSWKIKKSLWIWLAIVFGKTWDSFVATTTAVNREQVFSCVFLSCVYLCAWFFFYLCVCVCVFVGATKTTLMPCVQVLPRVRLCSGGHLGANKCFFLVIIFTKCFVRAMTRGFDNKCRTD